MIPLGHAGLKSAGWELAEGRQTPLAISEESILHIVIIATHEFPLRLPAPGLYS